MTPVQSLWFSLFITAFYPVAGKYAVGIISPIALLLCGTLIAILFFSPWLTKEKLWGRFFKKDVFVKFAVVGLFGTSLPFTLIFIALHYTTPTNSAILNQTEVVYSLILAAIFLHEKPTAKQLLGTGLVICGVILTLFNGNFSVRWKGDLIVLCTVWMFQVSHIAAKKLPADLTPAFVTAGRVLFSFFWSLPLWLLMYLFGADTGMDFSSKSFMVVIYFGIVNYVFGNLTWYKAIRNMDLSKATAVILSYPAFTYLISVFAGYDKFGFYQTAGLILALSGAYMVTSVIRKAKAK